MTIPKDCPRPSRILGVSIVVVLYVYASLGRRCGVSSYLCLFIQGQIWQSCNPFESCAPRCVLAHRIRLILAFDQQFLYDLQVIHVYLHPRCSVVNASIFPWRSQQLAGACGIRLFPFCLPRGIRVRTGKSANHGVTFLPLH